MEKPSDKELKKMAKQKPNCSKTTERLDALEQVMESLLNTVHKYGKTIEELEKDIAILKSNTHPPAFTDDDMTLLKRIASKMGM